MVELRGDDQHVAAVQAHQVGALPHVAVRVAGPAGELPEVLPVDEVVGAQQQRRAVQVLGLRAEHHPVAAVPGPDLRVAHVRRAAGDRPDERVRAVLDHPAGRVQRGQVLEGRATTIGGAHVAGVEEAHRALVHDAAARVAAVALVVMARRQRDRLLGPVHEVRAGQVRPELQGVPGRERVPLVAQVVGAPVLDQPVRVVEQPDRRLDVEGLAPRVRIDGRRPLLDGRWANARSSPSRANASMVAGAPTVSAPEPGHGAPGGRAGSGVMSRTPAPAGPVRCTPRPRPCCPAPAGR